MAPLVMVRLGPTIHGLDAKSGKDMDGRHKAGHDDRAAGASLRTAGIKWSLSTFL
jgi:hypothetical protein